MVRTVATDIRFYETQDDVVLNQANPISGTEYEVLPETTYVRVIGLQCSVTWTVQPTPLEMHLQHTNGFITYRFPNPVSAASHYPVINPANAENIQDMGVSYVEQRARAFVLEDKLIQLLAETTGGTTSNLSARAKYSRYI